MLEHELAEVGVQPEKQVDDKVAEEEATEGETAAQDIPPAAEALAEAEVVETAAQVTAARTAIPRPFVTTGFPAVHTAPSLR